MIIKSITETKNVITFEDGYLLNGMGDTIVNLINDQQVRNINIKKLGYPDEFIKHGNVENIEEKYNLDIESVKKIINKEFIINKKTLQK